MNRMILLMLTGCMCLGVLSCGTGKEDKGEDASAPEKVTIATYGKMPDGREVKSYTLRNDNGMEVTVINYGGIITSLKAPDRDGKIEDVTLGYDSLSSYIDNNPFFGALIGRYGNRIANGKFSLDGETYTLPLNNGPNHLHGGPQGFDKVYWNIEVPEDTTTNALKLTYRSADGEQGYPGNLQAEVVYTLTDDNELKIAYKATTDKKTVVNLTQHAYFNLTGDPSHDILGHELMIDAADFLPVDSTLIPTGELKSVTGTPFDFNTMTAVGERIDQEDEQIAFGGGYDHCWALNGHDGQTLRKVAALYEPTSGRLMEVLTTEPGIQFYSGNFLDGTITGRNGIVYQRRSALCLETQHYPDSPNKPDFPSVTLSPGDTYETTTVYRFSTKAISE